MWNTQNSYYLATQKYVHYTLSNALYGFAKEDRRGKLIPPNKTTSNLINSVKTYIQNLPVVPSHYFRKTVRDFTYLRSLENMNTIQMNFL